MAKLASKTVVTNLPLPEFKRELLGLELPRNQLLEAINSQRIHSAYLFSGKQGIGKATLGLQFAASLLAPKPPEYDMFGQSIGGEGFAVDWDCPIIDQMRGHSNPDFLHISAPYDEKKMRFKDAIPVEEIREIPHFLHLRASGESGFKVIMIDPVEAMNIVAANSLLKCLEEPPPQTIFVLISHNPQRLLPTILSRCQMLNFPPLSLEHFTQILRQHEIEQNQELLYDLTNGSAGLALEFQKFEWLKYWNLLLEFLNSEPNAKLEGALSLSEKLNKDNNFLLAHFQLMLDMVFAAIAYFQATGKTKNSAIQLALLQKLAGKKSVNAWLDVMEDNARLIDNAATLYLDKKQVIISGLSNF